MSTENVSKYKIELKSVYLTIVTWDLTERWTENVSNIYEICVLNMENMRFKRK